MDGPPALLIVRLCLERLRREMAQVFEEVEAGPDDVPLRQVIDAAFLRTEVWLAQVATQPLAQTLLEERDQPH